MGLRAQTRDHQSLFRRDSRDEELSFQFSRLRDCDAKGLVVRFAFGFAISVVVGAIGIVAGDRLAGLFLAFPAILPASLTLIAKTDGSDKAKVDAAGASFGGAGLAAYGLASWCLLPYGPPVVAELIALLAWCVVAIGGYLAVRLRLRS
jgi:hypothetical protein